MEYEVRYYYSLNDLDVILKKINDINCLFNNGRRFERTIQYNHPSNEYNFYSKDIDGRFRVRKTLSDNYSKCMISWKRRISDTLSSSVNKEEEVKLTILDSEYDNLIYILENVLHLNIVECYERYRTLFSNEEVEVSVDEYPFGLAIEIEAKKNIRDCEDTILKYVSLLDLDDSKKYRKSWDDKYEELCKEQNVECFKSVTFDKVMPQI